jgi:DNA polymerase-3 subunit chi
MKKTQIIFVKVPNNTAKADCLCSIIQKHFEQKQSILITVPNFEVADFVDQLLWKRPEESFLPHVIAQSNSKAAVVITSKQENLNDASILFNLCVTASPMADKFNLIYELLDETHPDKLKLSQERRQTYIAAGFEIIDDWRK